MDFTRKKEKVVQFPVFEEKLDCVYKVTNRIS